MQNKKQVQFRFVVLHLTYASYAYKIYWLCDKRDRDLMLKKTK